MDGVKNAGEYYVPAVQKNVLRRLLDDKPAVTALIITLLIIVVAVLAPCLAPKSPTMMFSNGISALGGPLGHSADFPLGTNQYGQDELSRMIWGGRTAIGVSVLASIIAAVLGLVLGALGAYAGGWVDTLIARFTNILMSFPLTLFAVAMVMILKPSVINIIIIMSVIYWTYTARLVRAEVLTLKEMEFITAGRALGAGRMRILITHVFPNVMNTVIVRFTLSIAQMFLLESALSYLGVGVQPPTPDWGLMIAQSQGFYMQDPMLILYPGLAIILTVIAFNQLGHGIQRAFSGR
jgi:ABC-type dipeptide/oligopeptide/nickel transport system permease subunit